MEIIGSRVILGVLILIHLLACHASGTSLGHISRKVLNGVILTELVAVTVYIIYDNQQTPPRDGWTLAIIGYLVVYGLILTTWTSYYIYTVLDEDKVYEMTISDRVSFTDSDYFRGTVIDDDCEVEVLLPYEDKLKPKNESDKTLKVKYDNVLKNHILVKLA